METIRRARIALFERTLSRLDQLARLRGRTDKLPAHLSLGIDGEDAVFFYLRRKGYTVVARRWSSGDAPGDVDLIAWHGPVLCFIEVKARSARTVTPAEVAVNAHKREILRRLARRYLRQLPQQTAPPVRFDVVSVYLLPGQKSEFEHFEAAFGWNEDYRN
jgi:putative endonuclease